MSDDPLRALQVPSDELSRTRRPRGVSTRLPLAVPRRNSTRRGHGRARGSRARVEDHRRVVLADPAITDNCHPIHERERLVPIVGDEDRGRARLAQSTRRTSFHTVARRLASSEENGSSNSTSAGAIDKRPRKSDTLLLPARELVRIAALHASEPDHLQQLGNLASAPIRRRRPKPTFCSIERCGKRLPS